MVIKRFLVWEDFAKDNRSILDISKELGINEKTIRRNFKKRGLRKVVTCRIGKYKREKKKFKRRTSQGYILIYMPNHPNTDTHGEVLEHRHIMELKIGRILKNEEVVHHINKIKDDNRIENLKLLKNEAEHRKEHKLLTWSRDYPFCVICKNNQKKHLAKGICVNCYSFFQRRKKHVKEALSSL